MTLPAFGKTRILQTCAVVVLAGATFFALEELGTRHDRAPASGGAASSGTAHTDNAAADRAHEFGALEAELRKKPGHVPILFRMAQLSREMGRPAEAVAQLRRVLAEEPKNIDAHVELGRALYETNDLQGAVESTKKALALDPNQVDALYNLGAIYANLNRNGLAREYWSRAVASGPDTDSGRRAREALQKIGAKN